MLTIFCVFPFHGKPHKRHKVKIQPLRLKRQADARPARPARQDLPQRRLHVTKDHFKFIGNRFKKSLDYQQLEQPDPPLQELQIQPDDDDYGTQRASIAGDTGAQQQQQQQSQQDQTPTNYERLEPGRYFTEQSDQRQGLDNAFGKEAGGSNFVNNAQSQTGSKTYQDQSNDYVDKGELGRLLSYSPTDKLNLKDTQTASLQQDPLASLRQPDIQQSKSAFISPMNDISGMFIARIAPRNNGATAAATGEVGGGIQAQNDQMNPYSIENHEQGERQMSFTGGEGERQNGEIDYGAASFPNDDVTMKKSDVPNTESQVGSGDVSTVAQASSGQAVDEQAARQEEDLELGTIRRPG